MKDPRIEIKYGPFGEVIGATGPLAKLFGKVCTRVQMMRSSLCLLIAIVYCWQSGCYEKRGRPIRVVIPNGLRGLVRIVEDRSGGDVPIENGEFVYAIPTNGVLLVKNATGFGEWHLDRAVYKSGEPLQMLSSDMYPSPPEAVAFYEVGRSYKELRFFLGTHDEMNQFLKSPEGVFR